jgi:hypothetical protein
MLTFALFSNPLSILFDTFKLFVFTFQCTFAFTQIYQIPNLFAFFVSYGFKLFLATKPNAFWSLSCSLYANGRVWHLLLNLLLCLLFHEQERINNKTHHLLIPIRSVHFHVCNLLPFVRNYEPEVKVIALRFVALI